MAYINSTRTVVNNVGTDIALAGAGNLFTVSGSVGGTKSLTLSDGFINNGAPEANLIVPLLFPNGHNDLGPSLYLEITVAGVTNPIPVVSNQNGTLAPIPHHEMLEGGSTVYKVVDPNTILNVYYTADYDGNGTPAFVVVGNPLVLSSSTYSIYANGYDEKEYIRNQNILSEWENCDLVEDVDKTMPYDGILMITCGNDTEFSFYVNGVIVIAPKGRSSFVNSCSTLDFKKGDIIKIHILNGNITIQKVSYYKLRDYTVR